MLSGNLISLTDNCRRLGVHFCDFIVLLSQSNRPHRIRSMLKRWKFVRGDQKNTLSYKCMIGSVNLSRRQTLTLEWCRFSVEPSPTSDANAYVTLVIEHANLHERVIETIQDLPYLQYADNISLEHQLWRNCIPLLFRSFRRFDEYGIRVNYEKVKWVFTKI